MPDWWFSHHSHAESYFFLPNRRFTTLRRPLGSPRKKLEPGPQGIFFNIRRRSKHGAKKASPKWKKTKRSQNASKMEPKMEPKSTKNPSRKSSNYHTSKKDEKIFKIKTFMSPLSYISVQTVEEKRLVSHFHLSCNKLAHETEKPFKMEPKWS